MRRRTYHRLVGLFADAHVHLTVFTYERSQIIEVFAIQLLSVAWHPSWSRREGPKKLNERIRSHSSDGDGTKKLLVVCTG